jgi:hypothetical protein
MEPASFMELAFKGFSSKQKEATWLFSKVAAGSVVVRVRCTRRFVGNAKKNVRFLSSRARIVPFIARNALQNVKMAVAKQEF